MSAVKIHTWINLFFHSAIYNCKCAYLSFRNSTLPQFASAQWSFFRLWQLENEEMEAMANASKIIFAQFTKARSIHRCFNQ
jgi:hypothetical protein